MEQIQRSRISSPRTSRCAAIIFDKPLSWRTAAWSVKNIFELKNAQRVLIDGNIFEHNWPQAQNGFSILFTVRNQDGSAPWSVVQDVTFTHNIVRHVAAAVNILGTDDIHASQQTKRVLISNNLFDDVSTANWGGSGHLFQVLNGTANVTIDHNTAFQTGDVIAAGEAANSGFTYTNDLSPNNQYGVGGDNTTAIHWARSRRTFPEPSFDATSSRGEAPRSIHRTISSRHR